ncbi:tyrosine-type recombinase/integrase [Corynebacterium nasicanis]|uniref:Tyrosine-type recombinase/integrase n=1 Tax=Corynebacterium nasicanis TaxID=1448267 RepID=A0ABW1QAG4_9CORY
MTDYITQVTIPAIERAPLENTSRRRYLIGVGHLKDRFTGYSIADATRFRTLESTLQDISRLHGKASAISSRTVLSRYVLQQLIRDEVIDGNPLSGMTIDLDSIALKRQTPKRGGQALTGDERERLVTYLLELDTTIESPPWTTGKARPRPSSRAKHDRVVALTLLQAGTGLRVSEANCAKWSDVDVDDDGVLNISVAESKTDRPRRIPILDPRINQFFRERKPDKDDDLHLIGSPIDPTTAWEDGNCRKCVAASYTAWSRELEIPLLEHARTHLWRTTLNELTKGVLSTSQRAAFFGHTEEINRQAYTDLTNIDGIAASAGPVLGGDEPVQGTTRKTTRKLRVVE